MSNRQNDFLSSRFLKPVQLNEVSSHTQPFNFTKYVKSPGIQSLLNNHGIRPTNKPDSRATKTPSPYHKPQYSMDKQRPNLQFLSKREDSQQLFCQKKMGSMGQEENFKSIKSQVSTPNKLLSNYGLTPCTSSIQKQLTNLCKKADYAISPNKLKSLTLASEHSKSKSVVETKENLPHNAWADSVPSQQISPKNVMTHTVTNTLNTSESLQLHCANHPIKKAKYQLENKYYCSKCAVELATKGIKLMEINQIQSVAITYNSSPLNDQEYKERELKNLLDRVKNQEWLELNEDRINESYQKNLAFLNNEFNQLQKMLQIKQGDLIEEMALQHQDILNEMKEWRNLLKEHEQEERNIEKDIKNNWNGVVNGIELQPFKEIISFYKQKQNLIESSLNELGKRKILIKSLKIKDELLDQIQQIDLSSSSNETVPIADYISTQYIRKTEPTPPKNENDIQQRQRIKTDTVKNNFFQNFFEKNDVQDSMHSCRANASNSQHQSTVYVSFENREMFQNALENAEQQQQQKMFEVMEEEIGESSSAHSPASGQTKNIQTRMDTNTNQSPQEVIPVEAFQKSKATFRTLFDEPTQPILKASPRYSSEQPLQLSVPSENSESEQDLPSNTNVAQKKQNYQKTLFCSPTFKDEMLQLSQSSEEL